MALEKRIVYDGAAVATVADAGGDHAAADQHADTSTAALAENLGAHAAAASMEPAGSGAPARTEIAFVDSSVPDAGVLIAGLDPNVEVVLIDSSRDGVEQIASALEGRTDVAAIHIISHGSEGQLSLGTSTLDASSIAGEYADELSTIRSALSGDADILVYGCDFGQGDDGQAAAAALAEATGADVAASNDLTGHEDLGGDWDLEVETGTIEAHVVVNSWGQEEWHHTLSATAEGLETLVNTTTSGTQELVGTSGKQIASDADGNYVVVWQDNTEIYARAYNADGTAATSAIHVNTNTNLTQDSPTVAADADGNFVVAWRSNHLGGDYGIRAQRFDASGNALGAEFAANTYTVSDQTAPAIAMSSSGFVISWTSNGQDVSGDGVYAQRFDSSGTKLGSEFRVNTTTSGNQSESAVAMDESGDFVVTWTSNGQDGAGGGIYAQRYNSSGVAQGSEFRVNTYTSYDQILSDVGLDSSGNFVVTWTSYAEDTNGWGVYAQRFDSSGTALGSEFLVNSTTSGDQFYSTVAVSTSGRFAVSWTSWAQDGSFYGQYGKVYTSSGAVDVSDFRINTTTTNDQKYGDITWGGSNLVAAWTGNGTGDSAGVFSQRYNTNTAPTAETATATQNGGFDLNSTGNDAYLIADDGSALLGGRTAFTLEAQFSMSSISSTENTVFSYAVDGVSSNEVNLRIKPDGRIAVTIHDTNATTNSIPALLDGQQHSISVSWSAADGSVLFYVDGALVKTVTGIQAGHTIASGGVLVLGQEQDVENGGYDATQAFHGVLYDARVFNDVRTAAEVLANATTTVASNESGLLANWRLNSVSTGGVTTDVVSGNDLTVAHASGTGFTTGTAELTLPVAENVANGTVVGSVTATDPDGTSGLSYSLTDTAGGRFAVNASTGQVTVADGSLLNYESATSHTVTVRVTDSGGLTYDKTFTVKLTNVNEAPTAEEITATANGGFDLNSTGSDAYLVANDGSALLGGRTAFTLETQLSLSSSSSGENPIFSYAVDGVTDNEVYLRITPGGRLYFAIHNTTQQTTSTYSQLYDGAQHSVGVSWDSINGAVAFYVDGALVESFTGLQTGHTIASGGTLVLGQDQDSEVGGFQSTQVLHGTLYDARIFNDVRTPAEIAANATSTLAPSEGGLLANWTFNTASTSGALIDSVSGNDLIIGHASGTGFTTGTAELTLPVAENVVNGTVVGSVTATDPDGTSGLSYSLTDTASGGFAVSASTGEITVADGSLLNYESATSHSITVRVTDTGGLTYDKTFTIKLTNVNEAPVITSNGGGTAAAVTAAENQTAVTTVTSTDVDAGATKTYTITGGADASKFTIDSSTGVLAFVSAPDYETKADTGGDGVYDVTVNVSDGTLSDTQAIAVTVTNVNEAPVAGADSFTTTEDTSVTIAVRSNDTDVDGDTLTVTNVNGYAISSTTPVTVTGGYVTLDGSGNIVFTPSVNSSGATSFTYTVSDGHGGTSTATVTGTITAVADRAVIDVVGSTNLIQNGSFESFSGGSYYNGGATQLYAGVDFANWSETYSGAGTSEAVITDVGVNASAGSYFVDMNGSGYGISNTTLTQTVSGLTSGASYVLRFDTAALDTSAGSSVVNVYWGGSLVGSISRTTTAWETSSFTVVGGAGDGSNQLRFSEVGTDSASGTALDNVRLYAAATLAASGNEDTAISIPAIGSISAADADGSESVAVTISSIPVGATLSDGINSFTATGGNTTATISSWNRSTLTITPASNYNGSFSLTLTATSTEASTGATATDTRTIDVTVNAVNDAPTGGVSISGSATQGQTLTAGNTLADADGLGTVSYQWSRDGVVISGATAGTYTLAEADVGHAITVTASYTDGQGTAEAITSAATSAVGNANDA
ncbi:MAG: DUF4347 domain-containing protein, partial [Hyphomicrobium sp.]